MKRDSEKPVLEWVAAAVGALITLALLGVIGWEAFTGSSQQPAAVSLAAGAVHSTEGGFVLQVIATNRSSQTAAALHIEGELTPAGSPPETSTATVSYVPGRSQREAALVFTQDPRRHRLRLRVLGYEKP